MKDEFFNSVVTLLVSNGMLDERGEYHEAEVISALYDNLDTIADAQVKVMANRFLSWKLPSDFAPDGGISFKAEFNEYTATPMRHEPTGTNLFNAKQAEDMVRHMLSPPNP